MADLTNLSDEELDRSKLPENFAELDINQQFILVMGNLHQDSETPQNIWLQLDAHARANEWDNVAGDPEYNSWTFAFDAWLARGIIEHDPIDDRKVKLTVFGRELFEKEYS